VEELTIGEVARRVGLRPSALRYYESVGLLPPPRRVNGQRRYDASVFQRLAIIQLAQESGFTLAEIETLVHGFASETPPSARWWTLAQAKLVEADALIQRAQHMKRLLEAALDCGCLTFEECVIVEDQGCVESKKGVGV